MIHIHISSTMSTAWVQFSGVKVCASSAFDILGGTRDVVLSLLTPSAIATLAPRHDSGPSFCRSSPIQSGFQVSRTRNLPAAGIIFPGNICILSPCLARVGKSQVLKGFDRAGWDVASSRAPTHLQSPRRTSRRHSKKSSKMPFPSTLNRSLTSKS